MFVTGTGTGVGKTQVAAMIARALVAQGRKVGVYKPAASGCSRDAHGALTSDDAVALWEASGRPGPLEKVCPQLFAAPLAPHLAARAEGRELDLELLRLGLDYWRPRSDVIVVEGAGGLFSPLGDDLLNVDLALAWGFPLVVVAANKLGAIHATLATLHGACHAASTAGHPSLHRPTFAAVVLNDVDGASDEISRATNAAQVRHFAHSFRVNTVLEVGHRADRFSEPVDWFKPAGQRKPIAT
ncbi:MAG: dethiobiotin synthase [Planctomycetaceae bacterium]|nr:dethiobiotin synthase [Planctomycetaceae bacterium]